MKKTQHIKWPFDEMAVGETREFPYGTADERMRMAKLLSSAKYNYGATKGIVLDVTPKEKVFAVTVLARKNPPVAKAKLGAPKKPPGANIRNYFWRQAFLQAMDNVPLSDLPACAIIASAAVNMYDEWVKEDAAVQAAKTKTEQ